MHPIDVEILAVLNQTPLSQVRYRAAVVTDLSWTEASSAQRVKSYRVEGATRYATNDSGGQAVIWYFTDDGRALLLTFGHDCQLNIPAPDQDLELQRFFYRGVPGDLRRFAEDRTEAYENLLVEDPETGEGLLAATSVAWFDGDAWHVSDGPLAYCEAEGIDPIEAALAYLDPYLLGQDFTPESYLDDYFLFDGWTGSDRQALLSQIRPVFRRHSRL